MPGLASRHPRASAVELAGRPAARACRATADDLPGARALIRPVPSSRRIEPSWRLSAPSPTG
jgi:hypothetical protein